MNSDDKSDVVRRLHGNHYFSVLVAKSRTWVRWGYAKPGEKPKPTHITPKTSSASTLGNGFESDGVRHEPRVADEVVSWGWKAVSDSGVVSTDWHLAADMEACLADAKVFYRKNGMVPDKMIALDDRGGREELPLPLDWLDFSEEARAAVTSWHAGQGWPPGWMGRTAPKLTPDRNVDRVREL